MKQYHVYIVASRSRNLYTGSSSNLVRRIAQHRTGWFRGHTAMYRINRLVYFEQHRTAREMVARERQIKAWSRAKRVALIEAGNPAWDDLAAYWVLPSLGTSPHARLVQTPRPRCARTRGDVGGAAASVNDPGTAAPSSPETPARPP